MAAELAAAHRRRLRELWRSAGWPCKDPVELDLLAAGLLQSQWDGEGRETLRLTAAGIDVLAQERRRNRGTRDAHEQLVQRVALEMRRAGRLVWRGLRLRSPLADDDGSTRGALAMPDVFSIRHTTVEDCLEPMVHEVKVSRADLLADLRHEAKGQAYAALACQCWYVLRRGIAQESDIPPQYGLMLADENGLELVRPSPRRPQRLAFDTWMALAMAAPEVGLWGEDQFALGGLPGQGQWP